MKYLQEQFMSEFQSSVYGDNFLIVLSDLKELKHRLDEALCIEGVLLVIIKKGHAQLIIDGEQSDYYEGDMFCCRPNVVIENAMMSVDIEVTVLFISPDYAIDIVRRSGISIDWTFTMMAQKHECIRLNEEQLRLMPQFLSILMYSLNQPDTPYKPKTIDSLMLSLVYSLCTLLGEQEKTVQEQNFSPKENLIERFFCLLKESNPANDNRKQYLSVTEYADRLHVSPKYFSTVCKNCLGKTAGQIIDEEIISSAKVLLHDNSVSIKQISDILGFANQSHFGTFFRRHTGMSPQSYRSE